ncbi:hypothetical protein HER10_EVM0012708 [Colletotrichum scovillei]|uniref:Uncharacterized protein n=2 Tax=Colletotrichum acutatum species complex TaxID=2707335 RepID=A0A9P7U7M4_9PEZI|nr:uncharacterized protein HER10_EVM0012708 [Colletotrichum scovillei]KXH41049.1 hypothetical protein CNYM01_04564 [Colletotrichum nymphaeae SA-01]KAF4775630.1 hypothetical protein HER10_EVM0012708 [Colletotrichum scovillei]KAG7038306.1 hypothetical protein JMJ78_0012915 [Colletotrichum scovillei]KAG7040629.1 hypothetical protein JMJ77_0013626 [Colletotrichum scovillei]KAG7060676.1 hypothetical protein JMJ76_0006219 [Colletotrichum scovillei]
MRFFVLIALATTALAVALPEPQKCNPSINCCTYTETACNNRGDACTATCNGQKRSGSCNDLGSGSLSCDAA